LDEGEGHEGGQGFDEVLEILGETPVASEAGCSAQYSLVTDPIGPFVRARYLLNEKPASTNLTYCTDLGFYIVHLLSTIFKYLSSGSDIIAFGYFLNFPTSVSD
jgi:hypothetical protein